MGLARKRGGVFEGGVDIPMRTMLTYEELLFFFRAIIMCVVEGYSILMRTTYIYLFNASNRNSGKRCQIYSKLTIATRKQNHLKKGVQDVQS